MLLVSQGAFLTGQAVTRIHNTPTHAQAQRLPTHLEDLAEVAHVVEVVALGGRGRQLGANGVVRLNGGSHDARQLRSQGLWHPGAPRPPASQAWAHACTRRGCCQWLLLDSFSRAPCSSLATSTRTHQSPMAV